MEGKNKKILLVEDDDGIREIYRMKLEMENYKVIAANDGEEALKLIKKERMDLILLDILLPKKDGFEILEEIRHSKNKDIKDIPVIIISNLSHIDDWEEAKRLGVSDYLVKAKITPQEMINRVDELL